MSERRPHQVRRDGATVLGGFLLVGMAATAGLLLPKYVVFNATPSLPKGFYRLHHTRVRAGHLVWFEAPRRIRDLSVARGYLPPSAHFAKRVIGEAGTRWCVRNGRFTVDGVLYGPVFKHDSQGRRLPEIRGCHVVPVGYVLVGTPHAHSVDSRYFGPIPRRRVRGTLTPLWTWHSPELGNNE